MSDAPQGPGWWQANDQKWYPPQAPAQAPVMPPQRQSSSNGCLIAGLVVGAIMIVGIVAVIAIVASSADKVIEEAGEAVEEAAESSGSQNQEIADDVTGIECTTGDLGYMEAEVSVTNHSSDPSTYFIEVVFEDSETGDQLDTTMVSTTNLRNDQSTTLEALTLTEAPTGGFTCDVADVTRLAS